MDSSVLVYNYDPDTKIFICTSEPIYCQIETDKIILPAHSTLIPLPPYDRKNQYAVFENESWIIKDIPKEIIWFNTRERRNIFLAQTDHIFLSDSVYSDDLKEKFKKYRQELRDITKKYSHPDDVIWPNIDKEVFAHFYEIN